MVNSKTYRGSYEKEKGTDESGCALADKFDTGRKKEAVPAKHTGAGKKLYGVRGRAGKPKNVERVSEDTEEYTSTTRFLESSLGIKSYAELAPHLAKGVERVMASLIQLSPKDLIITPELICTLHKDAFGELIPAEDDKKGRAEYLTALSHADKMDWHPLKEVWKKRLGVVG